MARNEHRKVFRAIQLVVLKKTLFCSFFVCSNSHSDMNSLNENHVADYNLGFLSLFYYLVSLVSYLKMLRRVLIIFSLFMPVNSVQFRRTMELFNIQKFLTCNIFFNYFFNYFPYLFAFSTVASAIIFMIYFPCMKIQNSKVSSCN